MPTQNKTLIAVVNARSRQDTWAKTIRDTWKNLVPQEKADMFFFVGRGEGTDLPLDTVALDCDDSYYGLPDKIRCIIRWAYDHGYEYMLKCDDDVVLNPEKLLKSGYENAPYTGRYNRPATPSDTYEVPMGFNYWISRRCMEILKDAPLPGNYDDEKWVAENLFRRAGITLTDDKRYKLHTQQVAIDPTARALRSRRPARLKPYTGDYVEPDYFAWCVFLDVGVNPTVDTETKLREFRHVFASKVQCTITLKRTDDTSGK